MYVRFVFGTLCFVAELNLAPPPYAVARRARVLHHVQRQRQPVDWITTSLGWAQQLPQRRWKTAGRYAAIGALAAGVLAAGAMAVTQSRRSRTRF